MSQAEYKKRLKALMRLPENQVCSDCPGTQVCEAMAKLASRKGEPRNSLTTVVAGSRTATQMGLFDQTSSRSTARNDADGLILLSRMLRKPSTIGCAHWLCSEYQFRFV